MSLVLGSENISKVYLGDTPVSKIYFGDTEVYSAQPVPVSRYVLNSEYIDTIGDVTIDNQGVATNFGLGDYLKFKQPFNPGDESYEIVIKTQVGNGTDGYLNLFGIKDVYSFVIGAEHDTSLFVIWASSNGTSWNLDSNTLVNGTNNSHDLLYWKLSYDSNTNTTSIASSTDGTSYLNIKNYNSKLYFNSNCYLYISGNRSNIGNEIGASAQVYLAESYYKIGSNEPVYFAILEQN